MTTEKTVTLTEGQQRALDLLQEAVYSLSRDRNQRALWDAMEAVTLLQKWQDVLDGENA